MRLLVQPLDYYYKMPFFRFYYKNTAKELPISGASDYVEFLNDFHNSIIELIEKENKE